MRSARKVLKYNKSRTIQDREEVYKVLLSKEINKGEKIPEEVINKVYVDGKLRINIFFNKASA